MLSTFFLMFAAMLAAVVVDGNILFRERKRDINDGGYDTQCCGVHPNIFSASEKETICYMQTKACAEVCHFDQGGSAVSDNSCDTSTLEYKCKCSNEVEPDIDKYGDTVSGSLCRKWKEACLDAAQNKEQLDYCESQAKCPSLLAVHISTTRSFLSTNIATETASGSITENTVTTTSDRGPTATPSNIDNLSSALESIAAGMSPTATPTGVPPPMRNSKGLSSLAKAGIGSAVGIACASLFLAIFFLLRRKLRAKKEQAEQMKKNMESEKRRSMNPSGLQVYDAASHQRDTRYLSYAHETEFPRHSELYGDTPLALEDRAYGNRLTVPSTYELDVPVRMSTSRPVSFELDVSAETISTGPTPNTTSNSTLPSDGNTEASQSTQRTEIAIPEPAVLADPAIHTALPPQTAGIGANSTELITDPAIHIGTYLAYNPTRHSTWDFSGNEPRRQSSWFVERNVTEENVK